MLIVPKIYKIIGNKGCNSYIVEASEGLIIINTGYLGSEQAIIDYIDAQVGASPDDVVYLIITHARRNCAEAAPDLLAYCENAKLVIHEKEYALFKKITFMSEELEKIIIEGDIAKLGRNIEIIFTPGYTPGSISVIFNGSIFSGGLIYIDQRGFKLPAQAYDKKLLLQSLRKLINSVKFENIFPTYGKYLVGNANQKLRAFIKAVTGE